MSVTVISAGSKRMLMSFGKGNRIAKARQQPDKGRQVITKLRTDGIVPAVDLVRFGYGALARKPIARTGGSDFRYSN